VLVAIENHVAVAEHDVDRAGSTLNRRVEVVGDSTAIFITFDEGGGYYDSGYVQPLDYFGDGTRIPLIVVSPWATGAYVSHEYSDHISILKFIERNWNIPAVTNRSRDNFPNPITLPLSPYVPLNTPALGDLFDPFSFGRGIGGFGGFGNGFTFGW